MTNRMEGEMSIYTLDGPLYFGSTDALIDMIMKDKEKSIAIEMDRVPVFDATGALALVQIYDQLKERGQTLYLIGVQKNVKVRLRKMKIFESLGNKPRFKDIEDLKYYAVHGYRKKAEKVLNH